MRPGQAGPGIIHRPDRAEEEDTRKEGRDQLLLLIVKKKVNEMVAKEFL